MYDHEEEFRVRWVDTDASGFIHYTNLLRYFEAAEIELLKSKLRLDDLPEGFSLPRVHVECDFLSPLRFDDPIRVGVNAEVGNKSITFRSEAFKGEELAAKGKIVVVLTKDGKPIPIPEEIKEKLKEKREK